MQIVVSLIFVLAGAALAAFAASRMGHERLREGVFETAWTQRHRFVTILRSGPALLKQELGAGQNTRATGLLLGGVLLVVLGIAYLFV
jgi:hypothetical protein